MNKKIDHKPADIHCSSCLYFREFYNSAPDCSEWCSNSKSLNYIAPDGILLETAFMQPVEPAGFCESWDKRLGTPEELRTERAIKKMIKRKQTTSKQFRIIFSYKRPPKRSLMRSVRTIFADNQEDAESKILETCLNSGYRDVKIQSNTEVI